MGTITRQALYDLVWSKKIPDAAETLGMEGKVLQTLCRRHQVPFPGGRYWEEVALGRAATKTPLRKMYTPELEEIYLERKNERGSYLTFAMGTIRVEGRPQTKVLTDCIKPTAKVRSGRSGANSERSSAVEKAERPSFQVGAEKILNSPMADHMRVWVHESARSRAISFMSSLLKELEKHGIRYAPTPDRAQFADAYASVSFELNSPRRRRERYSYGYRKFDYEYDGRLAIKIWGFPCGVKREWIDGPRGKIEVFIPQIALNCTKLLAVQKIRDEKSAEAEREHINMQRRQELAALRRARESARASFLISIVTRQEEVRNLEAAVALVEGFTAQSAEFRRMVEWSRRRLSELRHQMDAKCLEKNLLEKGLFPDPDELFDPDGDPS